MGIDPYTATMNAATAALGLATKIWDATPTAQQQAELAAWTTLIHGIGDIISTVGKLFKPPA